MRKILDINKNLLRLNRNTQLAFKNFRCKTCYLKDLISEDLRNKRLNEMNEKYSWQIKVFSESARMHKTEALYLNVWTVFSIVSRCGERVLSETAKAINKNFTGLKCNLQGFRIYFA